MKRLSRSYFRRAPLYRGATNVSPFQYHSQLWWQKNRPAVTGGVVILGILTALIVNGSIISRKNAAIEGLRATIAAERDDLAKLTTEAKAGERLAYRNGLQKAAEFERKGWEEGNAFTCNNLYGYGKPSPDGWRVTSENYGQDQIAHKATILYWVLGYSAEVPHLVTRKMCLGFTMPSGIGQS